MIILIKDTKNSRLMVNKKSKKNLFLCFCLVFFTFSSVLCSCNKASKIIDRVDQYYGIVKAIVCDPQVQELLSEDDKLLLEQIDASYKLARTLARSDINELHNVLQCGIDVCDLLIKLPVSESIMEEIRAVRICIAVVQGALSSELATKQREGC